MFKITKLIVFFFNFATMIQSYRKIGSAFILSLLVLFSSFSIAISQHYCGKKLVDTAINSSAKSCCASKSNDKEKGCCDNKTEVIKTSSEFQAQNFEFSGSHSDFVIASPYHFKKHDVEFNFKNNFVYNNYYPPKIYYDFQVVLQTFLI